MKKSGSSPVWEPGAAYLWDAASEAACADKVQADPGGTLRAACQGGRAHPALEALLVGAVRWAVAAGAPLEWAELRSSVFNLVQTSRHEMLTQLLGTEHGRALRTAAVAGRQEGKKGLTLLAVACIQGHAECVKTLLEMGADPEMAGKTLWRTGWRPLHHAAGCSDTAAGLKCAGLLLAAGADPGCKVSTWELATPSVLEVACLNGNIALARRLLAAGVNPNTRCQQAGSALGLAATRGQTSVVSDLIKAGALLDSVNKLGLTPLMSACRECHSKVVDVLLDAGARLDMKTLRGETASNLTGDSSVGQRRILARLQAEPSRREAAALSLVSTVESVGTSGKRLRM